MLKDFSAEFPDLEFAIETAVDFCRCIRNRKRNRKLLRETQVTLQLEPLMLLIPNNTRKWSGGCITITRMLRLEAPLRAMILTVPDLPSLDWEKLKDYHQFLFEFYEIEQLLQRDDANIIHYAHCFSLLDGVLNGVASRLEIQSPQRAASFRNVFAQHSLKLIRGGIFMLALSLWPSPSRLSVNQKQGLFFFFPPPFLFSSLLLSSFLFFSFLFFSLLFSSLLFSSLPVFPFSLIFFFFFFFFLFFSSIGGCLELEGLVKRQWDFYRKNPDLFLLPEEYLEEEEPMVFIMKARAQLNDHFEGGNNFRVCQQAFETNASRLREERRNSNGVSGEYVIDTLSVGTYWSSVASGCPELRVVVRVLESLAASEAIVERVFSLEGMIHDKIHNRLTPAYTEARVKVKGNYCMERAIKARAAPCVEVAEPENEEDDE